MAYKRKTEDVYLIETNYGYGWDVECEEDNWKNCKTRYHEYVENVAAFGRGNVRWRKVRRMVISPE